MLPGEEKHFINVKMDLDDYPEYSDLAYNNTPENDRRVEDIELEI